MVIGLASSMDHLGSIAYKNIFYFRIVNLTCKHIPFIFLSDLIELTPSHIQVFLLALLQYIP